MLYVKERLSESYVLVVDTDDGVAQPCGVGALFTACAELGLSIEGVTLSEDRNYGVSVKPYQLPNEKSVAQIKALSTYGVDIVVSDNKVVDISILGRLLTSEVKLKLSWFASGCGSCIVSYLRMYRGQQLILLLDDNIKLSRDTFSMFLDCGNLVIDLSAVTDTDIVESVYLYPKLGSRSTLDRSVRDLPDRKKHYIAVAEALNKGHTTGGKRFDVEISSHIEHIFDSIFKSLFSIEFEKVTSSGIHNANRVAKGDADLKKFINLCKSSTVTYIDACSALCGITFWLELSKAFDLVYVYMLDNYVNLFTPSEDFKKAFTSFCRRFALFVDGLC